VSWEAKNCKFGISQEIRIAVKKLTSLRNLQFLGKRKEIEGNMEKKDQDKKVQKVSLASSVP
jgi:hypothetical protein